MIQSRERYWRQSENILQHSETKDCKAFHETCGSVLATGQCWLFCTALFRFFVFWYKVFSTAPSTFGSTAKRIKVAFLQTSQFWDCFQNGRRVLYIFDVQNGKAILFRFLFLFSGDTLRLSMIAWKLFPFARTALSSAWRTLSFSSETSFSMFNGTKVILCPLKSYLDFIQSMEEGFPLTNNIFQMLRWKALRHINIAFLCDYQGNAVARGWRGFEMKIEHLRGEPHQCQRQTQH